MSKEKENALEKTRLQQMLKLVSQSFYRELVKFGINSSDIVTVSMNLLDHITESENQEIKSDDSYHHELQISAVDDKWQTHRKLSYGQISIQPLFSRLLPEICQWLNQASIENTYIQYFPRAEKPLGEYLLETENRRYFAIYNVDKFIGIIGGENFNQLHYKVEMKKFIGATGASGKGFGKVATFLFLYYVYEILKYNKVYIHSIDTNIRNINLNAKFGFELEGIFFNELKKKDTFMDSVRMGLLKTRWEKIFG